MDTRNFRFTVMNLDFGGEKPITHKESAISRIKRNLTTDDP